MKKGDVIRQKCVNTTFYLTGILAHKVNNIKGTSSSTHLVQCCRYLYILQMLKFSNSP